MVHQALAVPMKTERWTRVEELFHAACDRGPGARDAFLQAACGGDGALLGEVRSLLGYGERAGRFIEDPTDDQGEGRLTGGPLSTDEARGALRQMVRRWHRRCG